MGEYMLMPKLDMSMKEGTIVSWLVSEGEYINKGEYAVEVETGKVSIEVDNTAFSGKVLKIYFDEGDTVEVNTPILYIGNEDEEAPSSEEAMEHFKALKRESSKFSEAHGFDYDAVVIGAGQAGYTFALNAAKYTDRIAIVERQDFGGVCLNRGCIPSRYYNKRVSLINSIRDSEAFGVKAEVNSLDFKSMAEGKNELTRRLSQSVKHNLNSLCDIYESDAEIIAPHILKISGEFVSAKYIIIATGSHSQSKDIKTDGSISILNTEDMISIDELPGKIAFRGNSPYCIEQACMFSSLGSEVVLFSDMNILPDNYLNRQIRKILAKSKVEVFSGDIAEISDGRIVTQKGEALAVDVLVSEERRCANIVSSEVLFDFDDEGFYLCNDRYETNIEDVYVIGDANGHAMTAQAAGYEGENLADILFGGKEPKNKVYPKCINILPKIAYAGMFESELEKDGISFISAKRSFSSLPAAMASSDSGFIKIIADDKYGEIISVQVVCDNADEIIGPTILAMNGELTVDELSGGMFIHPSMTELVSSLCSELKEKISGN